MLGIRKFAATEAGVLLRCWCGRASIKTQKGFDVLTVCSFVARGQALSGVEPLLRGNGCVARLARRSEGRHLNSFSWLNRIT